MKNRFFGELRSRGVLGAVTAYAVVAAGGLQLADIVVHGLDLPGWSLRVLIALAALGLPVTFAISWFFDLTRHGFVRTVAPLNRPTPLTPSPTSSQPSPDPARLAEAAAALQAVGPGAVLAGRYQVERVLGAGGMGRVLAARDLRLGRRVAIKVVTGAQEPSRVRRFEQEARTAGSLEHPNVVAVYDLGEQDGIPFLVTELLDGVTLRAQLDKGPLPPAQVQGLALQLAHGLEAAHAAGVVHRDLKPENLFLTRDGRLKILDFGMAKLLSPEAAQSPGLTTTGVLFGTPGYLSPEQARGERAGPPSDVFSAGAVLYELLAGRRAFPGASLVEAGHAAITREPPALPGSVPAELAEVVARALRKEPGQRFADGGELARALERASGLAPQPVASLPGRGGRRISTAVMIVVTVAALGLAAASALFVHPSGPARPTAEREQTAPPAPAEEVAEPFPKPPAPPAPPAGLPGEGMRGVPKLPENLPGFDPERFAQQMAQVPTAGAREGVMAGVHAMEAAGQPGQALRLLEKFAERRPGDLGAQMELAALRRRAGQRKAGDAALLKVARGLQGDGWMNPVVRAFVGLIPEAKALEAAHVAGDHEQTESRRAQAYYYLGLKHETDDPPDLREAQKDYVKATSQEVDVPEAALAAERLRALGGGEDGEEP